MATYIAGAAWSAAIQDTARDVYYAYSIRHGLWFPMEGPILGGPVNGALHLGPAWYYVLCLPLWISDGWLAIALFAAALSSLKFPLAFTLGRRLLDARMGIAWACCLALPGWHSFEQLIFFNANPAAACVLGAVVLALRLREAPSPGKAFALGVLFALALHVHPTCAPIVALALPALWRAQRRATLAVLLAIGFVLPFAPYIVHQVATGAPDVSSTTGYMTRQVGIANLINAPAVLAAGAVGGPRSVIAYLWPGVPALPVTAAVVMALAIAAATLAAIIAALPNAFRARVGGLWLGMVIFASWIALLRPTTPWYFMYALSPFVAGLAAVGFWMGARRIPPTLQTLACVLAIGIQGAVVYRMASDVRSGDGVLSSRILDVKESGPGQVYHDTWFAAAGRASLGALLCRNAASPMNLHGHLAYIEDRSVGMDALFACGRIDPLRIGGSQKPGEHWVGMSRAFWSKLGASPECWAGSLGMTRATTVVWPAEGIAIPSGRKYFPRDPSSAPLQPALLAVEAPGTQALLVTNPLAGYENLADVRVAADGAPLVPLMSNDLSRLFVPPSPRDRVAWSISAAASSPQAADIVLFETRKGAHAQDCASWKEP